MSAAARPALAELRLADPPARWEALGFRVEADAAIVLGGVRLTLGAPGEGIVAWTLTGISARVGDIDGLATGVAAPAGPEPSAHPNGALALDHVVVLTPDFERTAGALEQAELPLRRIRDAGGFRQGFRRLGPAILELVEAVGAPAGPARFWGLVAIVEDLDGLAARLGDRVGAVKPAVQPGRRIATVRTSAGLGPALAFMSPEPEPGSGDA
ncbi:MAG TPA: hypothetical protein VNR66_02040 [Solirubrobacteraceae bacterium]|nr:hypothetical protein [Solirubrobacteraceae bacterium]